jgi:hypothetical protein
VLSGGTFSGFAATRNGTTVSSGGLLLTDSSTLIDTLIEPGAVVNRGAAAITNNGTVLGDGEVNRAGFSGGCFG